MLLVAQTKAPFSAFLACRGNGGLAERLKALVLKTSKGATPSRVRIPDPPPFLDIPAWKMMLIRPAHSKDWPSIWAILEPTIRAGETYALDTEMSEDAVRAYWLGPDKETFVAEEDGSIFGTYYMRSNQAGGGKHVCNCGYMTSAHATGRGIARQMCLHSLDHARMRGYRAMQFNFVVSTNERVVRLWQSLGFDIVGHLPLAFQHPKHGYVDALVMHQSL